MIGRNFFEYRAACIALITASEAALFESAFILGIDGGSYLTLKNYAVGLMVKIGDRYSGKQRLGVRMDRICKQLFRRCLLYHLSEVHYRYLIGEVVNYAEVVGNKYVG